MARADLRQRKASMHTAGTETPGSAAWLGGLGLIPFVGLAGATVFLAGAPRLFVAQALLAYGALILSFLGGAHWGMAIQDHSRTVHARLWPRLILSVIPALIGWSALLMPYAIGLLVLAVTFALMLWVDTWASRAGEAPAWYPKLHAPLTIVVVFALLVGGLG